MRALALALSLLLAASLLGCDPADPPDAGADAGGRPDAGLHLDAGPPAPPPPPVAEPGRHEVTILDSRQVVPSAGLPAEVLPQTSNNNLDVIRFGGRTYLGFRTGPSHFASSEVVMYVVSSEDEVSWELEAAFDMDTDLREPRWLDLDGTLFFYFTRLGTSRTEFTPGAVFVSERLADGSFSTPEQLDLPEGALAWRTRVEGGAAYMTMYTGGEELYRFIPSAEVQLRTTVDGRNWTLVDPARPILWSGGITEADFVISEDGSLHGVIRNDIGDGGRWGSKICRAPAGDIAHWSCVDDPKKYDSPLMFRYDGETYLFGRRNVTESGHYDLMERDRSEEEQSLQNMVQYWGEPKRCSLWRYVPGDPGVGGAEDRIAFILDLPSRGDTCFASVVAGERPDELVVYNYTSDPEGPDVAWNEGQIDPTYIYRHVLRFTPR